MVIDRLSGAMIWVPPRMLSSPLVLAGPAVAGAVAPPVVVASVLVASPRTETALPPIVTGTLIGMMACVPPPMLSSPLVIGAASASAAGASGAACSGAVVVASVLSASPRTDTALPPTVTGTATSRRAWVPDRMPSRPDVDAPSDGLDPASDALVVAPVLVASPRIETAFPPIVIGASSEMRACVPDRSPSSPVVSAA